MNINITSSIIADEISQFSFVSSELVKTVSDAIAARINKYDEEEIIKSKVYDVLFFYCSGSHVIDQPFKLDDLKILSKKIAALLRSSDGESEITIGILNKIIDLNAEIKSLEHELKSFSDRKCALIILLQNICSHSKYLEIVKYYEDEYGSDHELGVYRKCIFCCLEERGISKMPTISGSRALFSTISGTEVKLSYNKNEKKYDDYKL